MNNHILRTGMKRQVETVRTEYTKEEIEELRKDFVDKSQELKELIENKKAAMAEYDQEIKPLRQQIDDMLMPIKLGYSEVRKEVSVMANDVDGTIEFYDGDELIGMRKQYPTERIF